MRSEMNPSLIRTGVPFLVGPLLAWAATKLGLPVEEIANPESALYVLVTGALSAACGYLYYVGARFLEVYASPKWGYILGLAKSPAYSKEDAPSPGKGEDVEAVVVPEVVPEPEVEPEPILPELPAPVEQVKPAPVKKTPAKKAPTKRAPRKKV